MERNYFEEMTLQERAENEATMLAVQIERVLRVCGADMLNEALKESGVQLVVKPLPLPRAAAAEIAAPFGR